MIFIPREIAFDLFPKPSDETTGLKCPARNIFLGPALYMTWRSSTARHCSCHTQLDVAERFSKSEAEFSLRSALSIGAPIQLGRRCLCRALPPSGQHETWKLNLAVFLIAQIIPFLQTVVCLKTINSPALYTPIADKLPLIRALFLSVMVLISHLYKYTYQVIFPFKICITRGATKFHSLVLVGLG